MTAARWIARIALRGSPAARGQLLREQPQTVAIVPEPAAITVVVKLQAELSALADAGPGNPAPAKTG